MQLGRLVLRLVYGGAGGVEDGEIVVLRTIEHRDSQRVLLFDPNLSRLDSAVKASCFSWSSVCCISPTMWS
jgi:hypothetical protein